MDGKFRIVSGNTLNQNISQTPTHKIHRAASALYGQNKSLNKIDFSKSPSPLKAGSGTGAMGMRKFNVNVNVNLNGNR
jgi:hypothetical protein